MLPRALSSYPGEAGRPLLDVLAERIHLEPFNAIATTIFLLAIIHTFVAARFTRWAHDVQYAHDARSRLAGHDPRPSVVAEALHFLGEVEVVFGLWAVVLFVAMVGYAGWADTTHYFNDTVNYTEPMFVVVIMALAATRPIIALAEGALRRVAQLGACSPAAWWASILTVGPLLGSFITEPAAMTICALLLARKFYDLSPSTRLKYATLGLLFVNVSIGGTLTHFSAPPVLMVARVWNWDLAFMFESFGWRAASAIVVSNAIYFAVFRREFAALRQITATADRDEPESADWRNAPLPAPLWITIAHVLFMAWTVVVAHDPALFLAGFMIFLGFARATAPYQSRIELKSPLLVGYFLAGLVVHGGLQGWWIAPTLNGLSETPLFAAAVVLTAFNDNALITYLATLVPNLTDSLKLAVVAGAVTGGGLTVIANAPNPAGQALLRKSFDGSVLPAGLFLGAAVPTLIAAVFFLL